jgi:hypothetical protein
MDNHNEELARVIESYNDMNNNVEYAEKIRDHKIVLADALMKRSRYTFFDKVKKQECIVRAFKERQESEIHNKAVKNFNEKATLYATKLEKFFKPEIEDKWAKKNLLNKIADFKNKVAKTADEFTLLELRQRFIDDEKNGAWGKYDDLLIKQAIMEYWEKRYLVNLNKN